MYISSTLLDKVEENRHIYNSKKMALLVKHDISCKTRKLMLQ